MKLIQYIYYFINICNLIKNSTGNKHSNINYLHNIKCVSKYCINGLIKKKIFSEILKITYNIKERFNYKFEKLTDLDIINIQLLFT